ncbi:hypothetical protein MNBD_NITROSPINAE03-582 [hydrothermal vent metagenome]|uniref:Cytochrome C and Quinol oxidase polypeptide I n=1 Tax=hydrothermal vent metagenome TaxID=652676 RepID=A0A3B1CED8_9ZZZZ
MFTIVRRYIKTSLIFFLTGLLLGVWILYLRLAGSADNLGVLISAHTHLILFGFMVMLIMGVAYWMFPRPAKEDFRYSPRLSEINYWFITTGTAIRAAGEISMYIYPWDHAVFLVAFGAGAQLIAGFIFSWNIWTRIRSVGSHHREAKGEKF